MPLYRGVWGYAPPGNNLREFREGEGGNPPPPLPLYETQPRKSDDSVLQQIDSRISLFTTFDLWHNDRHPVCTNVDIIFIQTQWPPQGNQSNQLIFACLLCNHISWIQHMIYCTHSAGRFMNLSPMCTTSQSLWICAHLRLLNIPTSWNATGSSSHLPSLFPLPFLSLPPSPTLAFHLSPTLTFYLFPLSFSLPQVRAKKAEDHICGQETGAGDGLGMGLLLVLHLTSLATKHPLLYSITWPKSTVT